MNLHVFFYNHSVVLVLVRLIIQPLFLPLAPSSLPPTWHTTLALLLHLKMWPIRFPHLNADPLGFTCSTTLVPFVDSLPSLLANLCFPDGELHCSKHTFETVFGFFSHEPTPLFSNLIDMNESAHKFY